MLSLPKSARKLLEGSSLNRGGPRLQLDAMRPHPSTGSKILSASCGPEVEPAALSDAVWNRDEFACRGLCSLAGLDVDRLRRGSLGNKHWPQHVQFDPNFPSIDALEWLVEETGSVAAYRLLLLGGTVVEKRAPGDPLASSCIFWGRLLFTRYNVSQG